MEDALGQRALAASTRAVLACIEEMASDLAAAGHAVSRAHPLILLVHRERWSVVVFPAALWERGRDLLAPYVELASQAHARLVAFGETSDAALAELQPAGLSAILPRAPRKGELRVAVDAAFELLEARARSETHGKWRDRYQYELSELVEIARAITTERDIDRLLGLILEKSRFITGADAGSIYVVEGDAPDLAARQLHFKLSQNDSVSFDSREFTMPISRRSMAGYVALEKTTLRIDDVYQMPSGAPFGFDRSFDEKIGYRTQSMLCTPLVSSQGQVIGVLQLINKKREPRQKLSGPDDVLRLVVPFDNRSEELLATLSAQAGISLENAILYREIRSIFDGFVRASVEAIEARDPTTSGHSRRVAEFTLELAKAVERADVGPYRDVHFTRQDLAEIEYASLLHDFGKIGVREHVLVKAKKLYPHDFARIRQRFDFASKAAETELLRGKLDALLRGAAAADIEELERKFEAERAELEAAWAVIEHANEPTILAAGEFERIAELGRRPYRLLNGEVSTLLRDDEILALSVTRGSLTASEFDEIQSHVSHTYRFLSKIPWGQTFSRVPAIAGAHHERLNGTGYPNRLRADEIPVQAKMMTISDIFDALTAADRPYKRAVPLDKALDILGFEVKSGHIDGELVQIFRDARVWDKRP